MLLRSILRIIPKNQIADECHDGKGLLMTRYYLTPKIFGMRLVIHQFHRSDNDRHYHDHPWNFISIILKGSYIEHFPNTLKWYTSEGQIDGETTIDIQQAHRRWDIIKRPKEWKHWVELSHKPHIDGYDIYIVPEYEECWTLVLLYGKRRDWGFWTEQGWVKHNQYDCRGDYDSNKIPKGTTSNSPTN